MNDGLKFRYILSYSFFLLGCDGKEEDVPRSFEVDSAVDAIITDAFISPTQDASIPSQDGFVSPTQDAKVFQVRMQDVNHR